MEKFIASVAAKFKLSEAAQEKVKRTIEPLTKEKDPSKAISLALQSSGIFSREDFREVQGLIDKTSW